MLGGIDGTTHASVQEWKEREEGRSAITPSRFVERGRERAEDCA